LKKLIHNYVYRHPSIVTSPIKGDTILVPDPNNLGKKIKKAKLLLQTTIRELHNDCIRDIPELTSPDGKIKLSDTILRQIMPTEICKMSTRYKEMCLCSICVVMGMHQGSYNSFKRDGVLKRLKTNLQKEQQGSEERNVIAAEIDWYEQNCNLKETVADALKTVHCQVIEDDSNSCGLNHIDCVMGWCKQCPKRKRLKTEVALENAKNLPWIRFHTYETVLMCTEHGALNDNLTECSVCSNLADGEVIGKITRARKIVRKHLPFSVFYKDYYLKTLLLFKKHRFLIFCSAEIIVGWKERI